MFGEKDKRARNTFCRALSNGPIIHGSLMSKLSKPAKPLPSSVSPTGSKAYQIAVRFRRVPIMFRYLLSSTTVTRHKLLIRFSCIVVSAACMGCITPRMASSLPSPSTEVTSPQQISRQEPDVAEQKEQEPNPSLLRASIGLAFIDGEVLRKSIYELSSPEFEGRLTGTAGYALAARYSAERFRKAGVQPGGSEGTFFQPFVVEANEVTAPAMLVIEHDGWRDPPFRFGRDFVNRGFTGSGHIENAQVVFVGYGLVDEEKGWDDYAGIDARDRVALMFMGTPSGTGDWGEKSRPRFKATIARRHGVTAILLIDDPGENALSPIGSVYHGDVGEHQADIPQLSIRNSIADDLLYGLPHTAVSLRQQINSTGQPFSTSLKTRVTIKSTARYVPEAVTWNVVGYIEGSDPTVSDEYVVVGAHLDHVGNQSGVLFAGAQDNASGSVMVLAMAEAMSKSPVKPRRSVFFVLFAGEELFLAGSDYFASNPPWPIAKAVGMINLDMVGTGPELRMDGGATTPAFQQMAIEADRLYGGFNLADQNPTPAVPGASDHSAFINAGIPTIYLHSRGAPGRAHTPEDVASTIDYDAFFRTTRVVYLTLFQIADRL